MILRELRVEGFGGLKGEIHFRSDRINLLVGPNEAGKTTVAAAIAAAIYGLDEDRRSYRGRFSPHEQFAPWDGSTYAVELRFEVGGKLYIVNRHFGRNTVTIFAEGEGDVSEDFRTGPGVYSLGEMLLGLNLDQFVRSAFWLQAGAGRLAGPEVRPDETLASMLERLASTGTGDASAQAAIAVLEGALRQYPLAETRLQVGNQIKRLREHADRVRAELSTQEERLERAGLALGKLQTRRRRREALEEDRRRAAAALSVLALRESEQALERDRAARAQWEELQKEREELARLPGLDPRAAEKLRRAHFERESAERALEALATRRQIEWDEPNAEWQREAEENRAFAWVSPVHGTEIEALQRQADRLGELRARAAEKLAGLHAELQQAGISVERLEELERRFAELPGRGAQLLTQYPASAQAAATAREAADREIVAAESGMQSIARERSRRRGGGISLVALGVVAAAGSVWLALQGQALVSFLGLGVTLAALSTAAVLLFRAARHRAPERKELLRELTTARRHVQELREQAAERELELGEVARGLGYQGGEQVLRDYADYQRLVRETERLTWVRQEIEQLDVEDARLRRQVWSWAQRARLAGPEPEPPTAWAFDQPLSALAEGVAVRLRLQRRHETLEVARRRLEEEEAVVRKRLGEALEVAQSVVRELGTPEDDWERALAELESRRQARERLEALEKLLPDLEKQIVPEEELQAARQEQDRLRAEVEDIRATHPEWLTLPEDVATRADAAHRRATAERALEEIGAELMLLEREVGHLDKQGTGRASELRIELAELEREATRAQRFQESVQLAIETWKRVARETHALWSDFLTRRVNELLPVLGPEYRGFQVTDALDYSLVVEGQRLAREKLEQVLSAGTRDQLHLAIRIAICEFFSRGDKPVPLVLDDPFATADDDRAEAGLRFLAETVAARHQVVLLTCHRERLVAMAAREAQWFDERVHRIDLPLETVDVPLRDAAPPAL